MRVCCTSVMTCPLHNYNGNLGYWLKHEGIMSLLYLHG